MIRRARIEDVKEIQKLINGFAKRHRIIQRSLNDLYDNIRDIFVYESGGRIRGTLSLHVSWEDLAEIRSLAVSKPSQGRGIGKALIKAALRDAAVLGINRVFSLTYIPGYFHKLGFRDIDKSQLPSKIWTDCLNCPLFPECDEEAVIMDIKRRKRK